MAKEKTEVECHFCRTNREILQDPEKNISYVVIKGEYWNVFYRIGLGHGLHYAAVSLTSAIINDEIRESGDHATLRVHISRIAWVNLITVMEELKAKLKASSVTAHIPDPNETTKEAIHHFKVVLNVVEAPKPPRS